MLTMTAGQRLYPDMEIRAGDGAALRYQGDGNLVLYRRSGPAWSSETPGTAPGYVELQGDGNLVAYDASGRPYWASNTRAETPVLWISARGLRITGASTVWQVDLPAAPAPTPVALERLVVEDNRRWFATSAGRFDWREVSAFSLLSRLLVGERDVVRAWLRTMRAEDVTVVRVLLTLDGDYWARSPLGGRSFRCAPDMPGYWQQLDELAALTAEEGLYLRACFLGAVEPFGGTWYPDRRDVWTGEVRSRGEAFAVEAAQRLATWPHVVGELANEPGQIGLRESFDALVALGRKVKAVAPSMLLGGGAVDGVNDQDPAFAVAPFDYVDAHIERRMGVRGFEWVKRSGEYALIDQDHVAQRMPFISGEPVNFGEWRADGRNGDVEPSPSVAFAYGAVSRARAYNTCFHFDGGLWTTEPQPATLACLRAWIAGLNAFPMQTGTKWRGHWRESFFEQVWPPDDDVRTVEAHVAAGRGPWRVFGCDEFAVAFPEPDGWAARLTAPAERVDSVGEGQFQASVYRRT
ncbi:MAG: hypothetical protein AB7Q16_05935 [Vicinamibacterales bacterium]